MKNKICSICKAELNEKNYEVFNEKERNRVEKIRTKRGYCSNCAIELIMQEVIG